MTKSNNEKNEKFKLLKDYWYIFIGGLGLVSFLFTVKFFESTNIKLNLS